MSITITLNCWVTQRKETRFGKFLEFKSLERNLTLRSLAVSKKFARNKFRFENLAWKWAA